MSYEEFKDKLTAAGMKHDGHATHGSIEEQLKVIKASLHDLVGEESREYWKGHCSGHE